MMAIIMTIVLAAMSAQASGGSPSRWDTDSSVPAASKASEPAPAPAPAATAQAAPAYPPPPQRVVPTKSDLPGAPEAIEVPPGAVRLEDVKPGTKPKPQPLGVGSSQPAPQPVTRAAPPAPAPAAPAPQPVTKAAPAATETIVPGEPQLYDTRMQPAAPPPGYSEPTTWYGPKKTAQPAAPSRPATTYSQTTPRAVPSGGCKSDLPGAPCEETAVPAGAKRLEDIKPGTKPAPAPAYTPPPTARPAYTPPPAAQPAAPAPAYGGHKSDLPGGWDEQTQVPPGAVKLEDVKPGTRPAQTGAAQPAAPAAEPAPSSASKIKEKDISGEGEPQVQTQQPKRWQ